MATAIQWVMTFIATNHRNPSKYVPEERLMVHFLKRCRKLMTAGELQELRLSKFWNYQLDVKSTKE